MDAPTPIEATTRVRMGPGDARYGGDLIEGARTLTLFGDLVTELAIRTDGDEGLLAGYERVEFLAPVHVGDYLDLRARVVRIGNTSRTVEFEARKVIAARRDIAPSAADALDEAVVTCRALGTIVIPAARSRRAQILAHRAG